MNSKIFAYHRYFLLLSADTLPIFRIEEVCPRAILNQRLPVRQVHGVSVSVSVSVPVSVHCAVKQLPGCLPKLNSLREKKRSEGFAIRAFKARYHLFSCKQSALLEAPVIVC